jgi:hypothetical protein
VQAEIGSVVGKNSESAATGEGGSLEMRTDVLYAKENKVGETLGHRQHLELARTESWWLMLGA